jgi:hypothetical protein
MIEHAGCSWRSEDRKTAAARERFAESAAFHNAHGDDLSECDSWLCVCGKTDSRGGTWENVEDPDGIVHLTWRRNSAPQVHRVRPRS